MLLLVRSFCVVIVIVVVVIFQTLIGWISGSGAKYVNNNSVHHMTNY